MSLAIFVISTSIHLYASFNKNKKLRGITKPFILIALFGYYAYSVEQLRLTICLALFFSWLGDVLLIGPGVKWFTVGGISFWISHFFFIFTYLEDVIWENVNPIIIVILAIFFIIVVTILFTKLKPHLPKAIFYPMYFYLLTNGAMNCFAIFRMLSCADIAGIITAIGAALFFISDSSLFFVRFDKNSLLKTHFWVMLTYSIGEFLIVLGLIIH